MHATLDRVEGEKPDAPQETRLAGQRRCWAPDPEWMESVSQHTYETLRDQWMPDLPPVEFGAHLVGLLMEIGPSLPGGMGPVPLNFGELDAWCRRSGIDLQPVESRWLVRLSKEYLSENHKASKHFAPPPWKPETP